jgi:hypothetical protein
VSELIVLVSGHMISARDIWLALLNWFEDNTQIKRTKIMGLATKFLDLDEPLTNTKFIGKFLG